MTDRIGAALDSLTADLSASLAEIGGAAARYRWTRIDVEGQPPFYMKFEFSELMPEDEPTIDMRDLLRVVE